jgi:hypothetical protein
MYEEVKRYWVLGEENGNFVGGQRGRPYQTRYEANFEELGKLAVWMSQTHSVSPARLGALLAFLAVKDGRVFSQVKPLFRRWETVQEFVKVLRRGDFGRKSLGSGPRKVVAQWVETANDEDLFHTIKSGSPSISDVIKLSHPKAPNDERNAYLGWLLGETGVNRKLLPQFLQDCLKSPYKHPEINSLLSGTPDGVKSLSDMLGKSALAMYRRFPTYFSEWEFEAYGVYMYAYQTWGYLGLALEASLPVLVSPTHTLVSFSTPLTSHPGEVTGGKILGLFRFEYDSRTVYLHRQSGGGTTVETSWGKISEKSPFSAIQKAVQPGKLTSIEESIIIIHHNPPPADFVTFWNGSELSRTRKLLVICPNSTYTPPQLNGATFVQKMDDDGLTYLKDWTRPFLPTDQELSNISLSVV